VQHAPIPELQIRGLFSSQLFVILTLQQQHAAACSCHRSDFLAFLNRRTARQLTASYICYLVVRVFFHEPVYPYPWLARLHAAVYHSGRSECVLSRYRTHSRSQVLMSAMLYPSRQRAELYPWICFGSRVRFRSGSCWSPCCLYALRLSIGFGELPHHCGEGSLANGWSCMTKGWSCWCTRARVSFRRSLR
jgi:hypothetical protein